MRTRHAVPALAMLMAGSLALLVAVAQDAGDQPVVKSPAEQQFSTPPSTPTCVTAAAEQGDPSKGASLLLVKFAAGCAVPWHFHTPNEQVMMVSGVGRLEMKDNPKPVLLRAGAYAYAPSKHVHRFSCVRQACILFLRSDDTFDIHYVDASGKEIPADQALKK